MSGIDNLKPFTGADDPRRGTKPKGAIHLSTRIQKMLNDDDFTTELLDKSGKRIQFKGNPAEAIIKTAILKAMSGDKTWADWLSKNGYGDKLDITSNGDSIAPTGVVLPKEVVDDITAFMMDKTKRGQKDGTDQSSGE